MLCNSRRLHSYLGYQSPDEFEKHGQLAKAAKRGVRFRLTTSPHWGQAQAIDWRLAAKVVEHDCTLPPGPVAPLSTEVPLGLTLTDNERLAEVRRLMSRAGSVAMCRVKVRVWGPIVRTA
jgi:hypothetical protein